MYHPFHLALRLILLLAFCLLPAGGWAAPITLQAQQPELVIGGHLSLWEDPSGLATLPDVLAEERWQPSTSDEPNFGFTASAWWARAQIRNAAGRDSLWYLMVDDAILNEIDVYFVRHDGRIKHQRGGGWLAFSERDVPYRTHVFQLPAVDMDEVITVYFRFKSELAVIMPIRLIDAKKFQLINVSKTLIYALYFGFLGAILLFNLYVALRTESILHLSYSAYLCGIILISLSFSGLGAQFFWSMFPRADNVIFPIACSSAMIFGMIFIDLFLFEAKESSFYIRQRRAILMTLSGIAIVLAIVGKAFLAVQCSVGTIVISIVNAIFNIAVGVRQKKHNAVMLAIAWSGLLVGIAVFAGRGFGWVSSNLLTTHSMEVATVFECFLLVIALIEKTRALERELKDTNQRARDRLEQAVEDRARDIANAQQTLLDQERQSALSVFTAGVAHEINNPANFISAGVQNAVVQLEQLAGFSRDVLDEDADEKIKNTFEDHFRSLSRAYDALDDSIEHVKRRIQQLQALSPEGEVGVMRIDIVDFFDCLACIWIDQSHQRLEMEWSMRTPVFVMCNAVNMTLSVMTFFSHVASAQKGMRALCGQVTLSVEFAQIDISFQAMDDTFLFSDFSEEVETAIVDTLKQDGVAFQLQDSTLTFVLPRAIESKK
jgi:signal transduction histidine kinase